MPSTRGALWQRVVLAASGGAFCQVTGLPCPLPAFQVILALIVGYVIAIIARYDGNKVSHFEMRRWLPVLRTPFAALQLSG